VPEAWLDGDLLDEMTRANKGKRRIAGLDDEEALVLRWLRARGG
jgi:DNA topoisomerase-1